RVAEARLEQPGVPHPFEQRPRLALQGAHAREAVEAAVDAPDRGGAVAEPRRRHAVDGAARAVELEHPGRALLGREVDPVALSRYERAEVCRDRGGEAGETEQLPGLARAVRERRALSRSGEREDAADRVRDEVRRLEIGLRTRLPERREGRDHEGGLLRAERARLESLRGERAGPTVLDDEVGRERELAQLRARDGDASLAREQGKAFVGGEGAGAAPPARPRPPPSPRARRAATGGEPPPPISRTRMPSSGATGRRVAPARGKGQAPSRPPRVRSAIHSPPAAHAAPARTSVGA